MPHRLKLVAAAFVLAACEPSEIPLPPFGDAHDARAAYNSAIARPTISPERRMPVRYVPTAPMAFIALPL